MAAEQTHARHSVQQARYGILGACGELVVVLFVATGGTGKHDVIPLRVFD